MLFRSLAGGARGTLEAICAVVSCASLYASCSLSLRRVRQGPARPGRLDPPLIVLGALAAAGAVAGVGEQGLQMLVFLTVALAFALPWRAAVGPIAVLGGILFLIPRTLPSWTASEGAWIALVGAGGVCVFGRYIMEQRRVTRNLDRRTHELEINEERNRIEIGRAHV